MLVSPDATEMKQPEHGVTASVEVLRVGPIGGRLPSYG